MISILNTLALMDGFQSCASNEDPTNQTELDALKPSSFSGFTSVFAEGKAPTWEQVLAKKAELEKSEKIA
tara:strand:- start:427 stop:636 length:210 start_codon:yes stop_codon:yes gene_type:complete